MLRQRRGGKEEAFVKKLGKQLARVLKKLRQWHLGEDLGHVIGNLGRRRGCLQQRPYGLRSRVEVPKRRIAGAPEKGRPADVPDRSIGLAGKALTGVEGGHLRPFGPRTRGDRLPDQNLRSRGSFRRGEDLVQQARGILKIGIDQPQPHHPGCKAFRRVENGLGPVRARDAAGDDALKQFVMGQMMQARRGPRAAIEDDKSLGFRAAAMWRKGGRQQIPITVIRRAEQSINLRPERDRGRIREGKAQAGCEAKADEGAGSVNGDDIIAQHLYPRVAGKPRDERGFPGALLTGKDDRAAVQDDACTMQAEFMAEVQIGVVLGKIRKDHTDGCGKAQPIERSFDIAGMGAIRSARTRLDDAKRPLIERIIRTEF